MLADLLIAEARRLDAPPALSWMVDAASWATRRTLTADDLQRIERYAGTATDLHELLPAVLPLAAARWYETTLTAQHGTEMTMGYLAVPAADGIDVGLAVYAPAYERIIGPLGPVRVTATHMDRPDGMTDAGWREIRSATGTILRAILLEL